MYGYLILLTLHGSFDHSSKIFEFAQSIPKNLHKIFHTKKNVNKKGSYGCPTMSTYVYQPEMLQAKFPNPSNSSIPKRNLSILALDSTLVIQKKSQILQIKNADKNAGLWSSFNKNYWPYQQTLLQNPNCPPFAS